MPNAASNMTRVRAAQPCHWPRFETGQTPMYWPRPRSMSVNSGSTRNARPAAAGHGWRWKRPSTIASRRSGRRSALTLMTSSKSTGVPQDGQVIVSVRKTDMVFPSLPQSFFSQSRAG